MMAIEWEIKPMPVSDAAREWVTISHDAAGFWCDHWRRLKYDKGCASLIFRRGPYELPASAEAEGACMARDEGINFYMPDIRRKQSEPVRPADAATQWTRDAMTAWLALPAGRARSLAVDMFISQVMKAPGEMVAKPEEK